MNTHFDEYLNVKEIIKETKPALVVECGAADGKNTRKLIALQEECPFRLITISDHHFDERVMNIGDVAKDESRFKWIFGLSYVELKKFDTEEIGMCLIDTDHNYYTMQQELLAVKEKITLGGTIIVHDTTTYRKHTGKGYMYGTPHVYPIQEIDRYEKQNLGMTDAIWDFLVGNPNFYVLRESIESQGAMALKKYNYKVEL